MKKIFLAMTVLMMGSHAFADVATSSIPMSIEIPKQCTISNLPTAMILQENGAYSVGNYSVTCNTPYTIFTDNRNWANDWYSYVANAQNEWIETGVSTIALRDNTAVPLHAGTPLARQGYAIDHYQVLIRASARITATTRAGVYTDDYLIRIDY
jgi:hypothetical protein